MIIGVTTLGVSILLNGFLHLSFLWTMIFIVPFFFLQWYFAPRMIEYSMKAEPASKNEFSQLHPIVDEISRKAEIKRPELMVARVQMPNAFAYGNFFSGHKVAVTEGLLKSLEDEEVEAVLAHELGHIKHKDSEVMMFISILPAIFMMIGRMLLWSSFFGGRRRNGAPILLIAFGAMFFYFLLNLCILWFSRLREYYADEFSASSITDGSRKLQEGLAKINREMAKLKEARSRKQARNTRSASGNLGINALGSGMKALFITDPDVASTAKGLTDQELVKKYRDKETGIGDKIFELFTTHPEISKRLKALERMNIKKY